MPVYRCNTPRGTLSQEQRNQIAHAFTDVHCNITNAPRKFVHVLFSETPAGDDNGYPTPVYIDGGNRAGRLPETKATILDGLKEALAKIGDLSLDSIDGKISEGPASWSMEDGKLLPEPGQEGAEWYSETAIK